MVPSFRCTSLPRVPTSPTPGSPTSLCSRTSMPTWPSPFDHRLGTPDIPAIRFTREADFVASLVCFRYGLPDGSPPLRGSDWQRQPSGTFTSRRAAVAFEKSVSSHPESNTAGNGGQPTIQKCDRLPQSTDGRPNVHLARHARKSAIRALASGVVTAPATRRRPLQAEPSRWDRGWLGRQRQRPPSPQPIPMVPARPVRRGGADRSPGPCYAHSPA